MGRKWISEVQDWYSRKKRKWLLMNTGSLWGDKSVFKLGCEAHCTEFCTLSA